MEIQLDLHGRKRREAADCAAQILGVTAVYQGAPGFGYVIGEAALSKSGVLTLPESMGETERDLLLSAPETARFYTPEPAESATPTPETPERLTIAMPLDGFSLEKLETLSKLIASKATLLKKAVGAEALPVLVDDQVKFPWFNVDAAPEEIAAYTQLVAKLCEMAKKQKRVTATDQPVDNEKYAFRVFLLRLGFIGEEYAESRRILLQNLDGNGSWKSEEARLRNATAKAEAQEEEAPDEDGDGPDQPETPAETPEPAPDAKKHFSLKKLFGGLKLLALVE